MNFSYPSQRPPEPFMDESPCPARAAPHGQLQAWRSSCATQAAGGEAASVRAQTSVLSSQLNSVQQLHADHASQLKDVSVLRAHRGL